MGYFLSNPMSPLLLQLPEKKVPDPSGPYISTFQTKIKNVCLSVILEFCLLSEVCNIAYISLSRGLKYLVKARYIIQVYPNDFWFLRLFFWQVKNIALCFKKISQKWTAFVFASTYLYQTFTECVSNQYVHFNV